MSKLFDLVVDHRKVIFYWTVAIAFVVWGWTTLYVESYGNVWGGKDESGRRAMEERNAFTRELNRLETSGAAPELLYEQRIKLSLHYSQNQKHDDARKLLQAEDAELLRLPESEENWGRRVRIINLIGHTYIDEGLFAEAKKSFNKALDMAKEMQKKYFTEDASILILTMTNELGVLQYLEANGTLDGKTRAAGFNSSKTIFADLLGQIERMQSDPAKLTDESRQRLVGMKRRVSSNLARVVEDIAHEGEYHHT